MAKPAILTVDDDAAVLSAIARDLRKRYAERFRIVRADSAAAALDALRELAARNEPVALVLADQRMPQMNGVELLAEVRTLLPDARRALLTAYADTDAAIHAINGAAVHYYLLKPWDPPEELLYPVLDDLLDEWQAGYRPPFEGVRVIGHRWSAETHQIKDFLARNQVPYLYLDLEAHPEASTLRDAAAPVPQVLITDGQRLITPTTAELAAQIGLRTRPEQPFYDLAIVGGGPAGLAAAVYGASEGLKTVLIEREATGGQAGTSSRIENYLGFPAGLSGGDLARRATVQARRFGVEILTPASVAQVEAVGSYKNLTLADGSTLACHALIVAAGLSYRKLDAPGADQLTGTGVYYGASITEASACQGQPVFVVGAGNSAGQAAIYLAGFASHVTILVRGTSLRAKMSEYLVERIENSPQITVLTETEVAACHGTDHLERVTLINRASNAETTYDACALFIFTGAVPATDWLVDIVRHDKNNFILTGAALSEAGKLPNGWPLQRPPYLLESSVPGIFVVGDVRAGSVKRVASAVGEGSIAVQFVHEYLSTVR